MYFRQFFNYLPLKKGGALHLNKLESFVPKDVLCEFGWNWPSGSGEEEFWISLMYFRYFELSPLGKGRALYLNKLESPSPKDALFQVWLKLA